MYTEEKNQDELRSHYMGLGMGIGMPIGIVLSSLFGIVMKTPGLIGVGAGIGISLSVAIGEGLHQRNQEL